jgi:hypothetical protein
VEETVQPDLRSRPPKPNKHIGNRYSPTFEQTAFAGATAPYRDRPRAFSAGLPASRRRLHPSPGIGIPMVERHAGQALVRGRPVRPSQTRRSVAKDGSSERDHRGGTRRTACPATRNWSPTTATSDAPRSIPSSCSVCSSWVTVAASARSGGSPKKLSCTWRIAGSASSHHSTFSANRLGRFRESDVLRPASADPSSPGPPSPISSADGITVRPHS